MDRTRTVKLVQWTCNKTCSQQINMLKQHISHIKLKQLNEDESTKIDDYMDDVITMENVDRSRQNTSINSEKRAYATKLISENIMEIFKNIVPEINKIMESNKNARRKQRDEMMNLVIALTNLADMMPPMYHTEMFIELDKVIQSMNSRAALKFCSTLFSLHFYAHRSKVHSGINNEDSEDSISSEEMCNNLIRLYSLWLQQAGKSGCLQELPHTIDEIKSFIAEWNIYDTPNEAKLWRVLFEQLKILSSKPKSAFAANDIDKEQTTKLTNKVMLKMLDAASRVLSVQDQIQMAKDCIYFTLKHKQTFLYDSLLNTACMNHIKDSADYWLLNIFTTGVLKDFRKFCQDPKGQKYLDSIKERAKMDPRPLLERKIRQLTFIQMACQCQEDKKYANGEPNKNANISLDQLKIELELKEDDDVEEFVIDAIRTNMVKCKLSQATRTVIIHYAVTRQFTKSHWEELDTRLGNWLEQILKIQTNFDDIINNVAPRLMEGTLS